MEKIKATVGYGPMGQDLKMEVDFFAFVALTDQPEKGGTSSHGTALGQMTPDLALAGVLGLAKLQKEIVDALKEIMPEEAFVLWMIQLNLEMLQMTKEKRPDNMVRIIKEVPRSEV